MNNIWQFFNIDQGLSLIPGVVLLLLMVWSFFGTSFFLKTENLNKFDNFSLFKKSFVIFVCWPIVWVLYCIYLVFGKWRF